MNADRCWTCGRPRGLSQRRASWSLNMGTPFVPRTADPTHTPAQSINDLICVASIYRNGGTSGETHLCDACLAIGVRAIKVKLEELLGELDIATDKDAALADLTQRLGALQARHKNVCFDHDRMQDRLRDVLPPKTVDEPETVRMARWECDRGKAENRT
jgi:hypothetical protein